MLWNGASLGHEKYIEGVAGSDKGSDTRDREGPVGPVEKGGDNNKFAHKVGEGGKSKIGQVGEESPGGYEGKNYL